MKSVLFYVVIFVLGGAIGRVLELGGITSVMWQYWAILGLIIALIFIEATYYVMGD